MVSSKLYHREPWDFPCPTMQTIAEILSKIPILPSWLNARLKIAVFGLVRSYVKKALSSKQKQKPSLNLHKL